MAKVYAKTKVLQNVTTKKWTGELWIDNVLYYFTPMMMSKANAILALNREIDRYNNIHSKNIPHHVDEPTKEKSTDKEKAVTVTPETHQIIPLDNKPKLPRKPHRKPFTPYGLNGYLVDNKGNVRLMLDRKANARTIVLEPAMFTALAEMVKKTQEQTQ